MIPSQSLSTPSQTSAAGSAAVHASHPAEVLQA